MSGKEQVRVLMGELEKHQAVLGKISTFYDGYVLQTVGLRDRTPEQAIVVADVLANYYTCLETVFLRISQFFENSLANERWHQDLLHKMTLRIPGVREAVVADSTASVLLELLKFRHFKRYYFQFEYDWDRLDYLRKKFDQLRPAITTDLEQFKQFLIAIISAET
jgi:hypothetical protein